MMRTITLLVAILMMACFRGNVCAKSMPLDLRSKTDSANFEKGGHTRSKIPIRRHVPLRVEYNPSDESLIFDSSSEFHVTYSVVQDDGEEVQSGVLWLCPNEKSAVYLSIHGTPLEHCMLYVRVDDIVYEADFK